MAKKRPTKRAAVKTAAPNAQALSAAELARLLTQAGGGHVSAADIARDVEAGAPTNPDGTLHLVRYAAWLASQVP